MMRCYNYSMKAISYEEYLTKYTKDAKLLLPHGIRCWRYMQSIYFLKADESDFRRVNYSIDCERNKESNLTIAPILILLNIFLKETESGFMK